MGTSNSLQVESIDPLTKKLPPYLCQQTAQTGCICESKVATQEAFKKSHILIVESPEHVARCDPFGWKSRLDTQSLCPSPDIISSP
jgi:hypothetical protein